MHFENSRSRFSTCKEYFRDLILFFDHKSLNDEKKDYKDTFKQMNGESIRSFYLRHLEKTQHLQTLDLFPSTEDKSYHRTFMDDFFCRLNNECYAIIDNKLRDKDSNPEDFSCSNFFDWVDNTTKFNNSILAMHSSQRRNTNQNNSNSNKSNQHSKTETSNDYCYYCGGTGHRFKNKFKAWICPDKLAGKPGCKEYYAYNDMKKQSSENKTEATEIKADTISAVALNTAIDATNKISSNKRAVAITTEIAYKGTRTWFNQEKTILDLGGCENLVNSNFVKNHLQVPIQKDLTSAATDIQKSVNGDTFHFDSFIEIQCNFKGHREKIRFFLMDDLPLPFLLGFPFFKEKGAIFDLNSNLPSVTFCKTDLKPTLTLASTADNKTTFIFPFANDFTPIINSAFVCEPTSTVPDFEQLFQEFSLIFLRQETFDDIIIESTNDNESDLNPSSSSGSLEHDIVHDQPFGTDETRTNFSDTGSEIFSFGSDSIIRFGADRRIQKQKQKKKTSQ